jgi:hypothetical protein
MAADVRIRQEEIRADGSLRHIIFLEELGIHVTMKCRQHIVVRERPRAASWT